MKKFLLSICVAVVPASAQWHHFGGEPLHPTGYVGLGFSTPVNPLANRLDAGWNLAGGVGVTQTYVGVMVDAMFTDFGITNSALIRARARSGSQKYWALTVDPIFHVNDRGPVDFYLTGGAGLYSQITQYRTSSALIQQGIGQFDLINSEHIYRPGVNLGVGFSFSPSGYSNIKIFTEARYHHMFTPGVDASFIPVTLGVRF